MGIFREGTVRGVRAKNASRVPVIPLFRAVKTVIWFTPVVLVVDMDLQEARATLAVPVSTLAMRPSAS